MWCGAGITWVDIGCVLGWGGQSWDAATFRCSAAMCCCCAEDHSPHACLPAYSTPLPTVTCAQLVCFLDKLAELRSLQPLHPSITRK